MRVRAGAEWSGVERSGCRSTRALGPGRPYAAGHGRRWLRNTLHAPRVCSRTSAHHSLAPGSAPCARSPGARVCGFAEDRG